MFSIVIPLFNKEKFIKRCLNSVLSQTISNFEVIIVDDGSTDSSIMIVEEFVDNRINIISQKNSGPGAARNLGIRQSKGDWIAFIDADDVWTSVHLEELTRAINYQYDVCIVATKVIECPAQRIPNYNFLFNKKGKVKIVDYFLRASKKPEFIHSSCVAIKREVFSEIGGFKHWKYGEDQEFWTRVCLRYPCVVSNKPTAFYCRGTGGIMDSYEEYIYANKFKFFEKIEDLNPVVALLCNELEKISINNPKCRSIIQYINSSISFVIRVNFYNLRIVSAKQYSTFYMDPVKGTAFMWLHLLKLPNVLLIIIARSRFTMRWFYRFANNYINSLRVI